MAPVDEMNTKLFTVAELASHNQPADLWIAVDGKGSIAFNWWKCCIVADHPYQSSLRH